MGLLLNKKRAVLNLINKERPHRTYKEHPQLHFLTPICNIEPLQYSFRLREGELIP
jgi:hypothetical protein